MTDIPCTGRHRTPSVPAAAPAPEAFPGAVQENRGGCRLPAREELPARIGRLFGFAS